MALSSITEKPNPLTANIDQADAASILRLLEATDEQIFTGWDQWQGLTDERFKQSFIRAQSMLQAELHRALTDGYRVKVIFSGAGTSGRIAMLFATTFNPHYREIFNYDVFDFIIAGGPKALIKAQEGAEDDALTGMADLESKTADCQRFVFIGITCGLSANYIAGQIYHTIHDQGMPAFLIGFNPIERARTVQPENWPYSFAQVLKKVHRDERMVMLNPVIGPEPITGSTRMKGGTATKIIGDMLCYMTLIGLKKQNRLPMLDVFQIGRSNTAEIAYEVLLDHYRRAKSTVYNGVKGLTAVLEQAGASLKAHGRIAYLGEGVSGKLGIVDASECPPTYGADFNDVRGFIANGWDAFCPGLENTESWGTLYQISIEQFFSQLAPEMTADDTIIVTGSQGFLNTLQPRLDSLVKGHIFSLCLQSRPAQSDCSANMKLPWLGDSAELSLLQSVAVKLIYNAITTAAHIFKGKVYGNKMIDLRISNNKLFFRSINILKELTGVDDETAKTALLRSVYGQDNVSDIMPEPAISKHIALAIARERIIPVAMVLAASSLSVAEARKRVEADPVVRNIIQSFTV